MKKIIILIVIFITCSRAISASGSANEIIKAYNNRPVCLYNKDSLTYLLIDNPGVPEHVIASEKLRDDGIFIPFTSSHHYMENHEVVRYDGNGNWKILKKYSIPKFGNITYSNQISFLMMAIFILCIFLTIFLASSEYNKFKTSDRDGYWHSNYLNAQDLRTKNSIFSRAEVLVPFCVNITASGILLWYQITVIYIIQSILTAIICAYICYKIRNYFLDKVISLKGIASALVISIVLLSVTGCLNTEKDNNTSTIDQVKDEKVKLIKVLETDGRNDVFDNDVNIDRYYLYTMREQFIPVETKGTLQISSMSIIEYIDALASNGKLKCDTITAFDNGEPGMSFVYIIYNIKNIKVAPATIY